MSKLLVSLWLFGLELIFVLTLSSDPMADSIALRMVRSKIELAGELHYLKLMVPKTFHSEFIRETRGWSRAEKVRVLAQAWVESNGWTVMKTVPNWDGSRDLGPLGLNSKNLKDPDFISHYWPERAAKEIRNKNVLYMIACLRFIHAIFGEFGVSKKELINYNAGYNCAIRDIIPTTTRDYIRRVMVQEKSISELLSFYDQREKIRIEYLSNIDNDISYRYLEGCHIKPLVTVIQPYYDRRSFVVHKLSWVRIYNWWESVTHSHQSSESDINDEFTGEHLVTFLI